VQLARMEVNAYLFYRTKYVEDLVYRFYAFHQGFLWPDLAKMF